MVKIEDTSIRKYYLIRYTYLFLVSTTKHQHIRNLK